MSEHTISATHTTPAASPVHEDPLARFVRGLDLLYTDTLLYLSSVHVLQPLILDMRANWEALPTIYRTEADLTAARNAHIVHHFGLLRRALAIIRDMYATEGRDTPKMAGVTSEHVV